jgi:hypothetical protein
MTAIFTNRWVQAGLAVSAIIVGVLVFNQSDNATVATTEAVADTPVTTAASPDNADDAAALIEAAIETIEPVTGAAPAAETTEATE